MFAYAYRDSYLYRLNPVVKLAAVFSVTILISLTSGWLLPLLTAVTAFTFTCISGKINPLVFIKKIRIFILVSVSFMFFMLIIKGLEGGAADMQLWIFGWTYVDLYNIISIGLRILSISLMTLSFVLSTAPNDLVLSLIMQMKIPYVHGYAALAAYRFLPTIQAEARGIRLAQEIRGIEFGNGIKNRLKSPFRIILPMICIAARRGERIALAMDSRGLGVVKNRTFFKKTQISKSDIVFLAAAALFYILAMIVLLKFGLTAFGFSLSAGLT